MFFKKHAGDGAEKGAAPLEGIRRKLRTLQGADTPVDDIGGDRTVANDGAIPADKKAQILRDEALVAAALTLVGVDYAALITSDVGPNGEKSPYAMAVAANPGVIAEVLKAENPVLAALEVATRYKPYAEFTAKYGQDPEAIKQAIAREVQAKPKDEPVARKVYGPVFSGTYGAPQDGGVAPARGDLKKLFGR